MLKKNHNIFPKYIKSEHIKKEIISLQLYKSGHQSSIDINIRCREEIMYKQILKIGKIIDENQGFKNGLNRLSKMVTNDYLKDGKIYKENKEFQQARESINIPSSYSYWGEDLSFTNLSHKHLTGLKLKDYIFSAADLANCVFIDCTFYSCYFYGSNLYKTRFVNCTFKYMRDFYKTKNLNRAIFNQCTFEPDYYYNVSSNFLKNLALIKIWNPVGNNIFVTR